MAYEAKDGSKHSMASRMRAHNTSMDAKQTKDQGAILDQPSDGADGGEMEQPADQQPQGLSDPQQVDAAYQQVMGQVQQGQQPDPAAAGALAEYFGQFAQAQEPDGDEGAPGEGM